jgi:predicted nucleotidyltransferase
VSTEPPIHSASLGTRERGTIERFVALLEERLGDRLESAWLYGSRARGETPHPESDVDVMVVTRDGGADRHTVHELLFEAAELEGSNPFVFSVKVVDPEWLAGRRRIESFFVQEVDRDKLILTGRP